MREGQACEILTLKKLYSLSAWTCIIRNENETINHDSILPSNFYHSSKYSQELTHRKCLLNATKFSSLDSLVRFFERCDSSYKIDFSQLRPDYLQTAQHCQLHGNYRIRTILESWFSCTVMTPNRPHIHTVIDRSGQNSKFCFFEILWDIEFYPSVLLCFK